MASEERRQIRFVCDECGNASDWVPRGSPNREAMPPSGWLRREVEYVAMGEHETHVSHFCKQACAKLENELFARNEEDGE